jgi:hypothetical protein
MYKDSPGFMNSPVKITNVKAQMPNKLQNEENCKINTPFI